MTDNAQTDAWTTDDGCLTSVRRTINDGPTDGRMDGRTNGHNYAGTEAIWSRL